MALLVAAAQACKSSVDVPVINDKDWQDAARKYFGYLDQCE
jgi:hypothetical protein